jgi:hypothetical protein
VCFLSPNRNKVDTILQNVAASAVTVSPPATKSDWLYRVNPG